MGDRSRRRSIPLSDRRKPLSEAGIAERLAALPGWQRVEVGFTTHSAGDRLTALDFAVAEVIEALPYRKPQALSSGFSP